MSTTDPAQHCFREDNCVKHEVFVGAACCCCGEPAEIHSGCDCEDE